MYLTDDPEHMAMWKEFVRLSNEAHAKTMAGPNYIQLRKHLIEEVMTTQEDFNMAWANYTHEPNDPKDRLRDLVTSRLDINIMYIQAMRVLEESYLNGGGYVDWDEVKKDVATLSDDEVMAMFYEFIKKHKGDK